MKKIKTGTRYVPTYENGSSFDEITKFLRSQLAAFKPTQVPKGAFAGSYAALGGALGSQIMTLGAQKTEETPFVANPTDVAGAFQKVPVNQAIAHQDNFLLGQQRSLLRHADASGADAFTSANILAGPMKDAANIRSSTSTNLLRENVGVDRQRSMFNIEQGSRINDAQNMQRSNENQKLSLLGGKLAEGAGAFANLDNRVFEAKQQVDYMNNAKVSQMMNQLFTANFYKSLYK